MRVLLNTTIGGQPSGTIADVPDDDVAGYLAQGMVSFVSDDHPDLVVVESAAVEPAESATAPKPRKRKAG